MWYFFGARRFLDPGLSASGQDALMRLFQTGWFVESLLTQTLIVHIIRTRRIPFIGSRASPLMMFATILIMAIGSWLPYSPLAPMLGFVPLPWTFWLWIAGFLVAYSVLTHNVKVWFFKRFGMD